MSKRKRPVKPVPKYQSGDRVLYKNDGFNIARSVGTVARHRGYGFANGRNNDDGWCCTYAVIWDLHAHKPNADHTSVDEHNIVPEPIIEQLGRLVGAAWMT